MNIVIVVIIFTLFAVSFSITGNSYFTHQPTLLNHQVLDSIIATIIQLLGLKGFAIAKLTLLFAATLLSINYGKKANKNN